MSGAAAAAAAAAAKRRAEEQEEEEMTTYGSDDLQRDWEFKIVRATTAVFRNPRNLQRLLEEEGRAGWVLVEKFDNMRIRLKRPRSARANDATLPAGVDPYRVHYGMQPGAFAVLLVVMILAFVAVLMGFIAFLVR